MDLSAFQGYLFDLDGTLIDTAPDINRALCHALENAGFDAVDEATTRHWVGHGARACLEQALEGKRVSKRKVERMLDDFLGHYRRHIADHSRPYPTVVDALAQLAERGARLGVVTNKRSDLTVPLLEALELLPMFRTVISGDTAANPKPSADPMLMACSELGLGADDVLMVGDSETDVLAARAVGCAVVCVPYGYNHGIPPAELGADALIESSLDLV